MMSTIPAPLKGLVAYARRPWRVCKESASSAGTTARINDSRPAVVDGDRDKVDHKFLIAQCIVGLLAMALLIAPHERIFWQASLFVQLGLASLLICFALNTAKQSDVLLQMLCVFATLFLGPVGAAGAVLLLLSGKRKGKQTGVLDAWRARLRGHQDQDLASQIHGKITTGRARRVDTQAPQNFSVPMKKGRLRDVQTILGRIALNYHPEYFPILECALQCDEPSIRVQAAAIIANLRSRLKARLRAVAESPSAHPGETSAKLEEVRSCIASRLLEQSDIRIARALAKQLCHSLIEMDPVGKAFHEAKLCELLFEEGEYAGLLERFSRLDRVPKSLEHLEALTLMKLGRHRELAEKLEALQSFPKQAGLGVAVSC